MDVEVCPPDALDADTGGPLRLVRIAGGTVTGSLEGEVLPGGTDWQTVSPDGAVAIDARYLLQLVDGTRVELQSRGLRSPGASGFWSTIWLRTASPDHAALNQTQYAGLGRKRDRTVIIEAFAFPPITD
ncbi:DUF3237 domain-containing protein [Polymorphobacter sp.]|uniref:DUF3237 domain-containing protein n=1 Tax=Polymorphobacter sp. TaxID=1909290 RepID=UPI003F700C4D